MITKKEKNIKQEWQAIVNGLGSDLRVGAKLETKGSVEYDVIARRCISKSVTGEAAYMYPAHVHAGSYQRHAGV